MTDTGSDDSEDLREALKRVAVALKQAEVPFALAGGYAAFAHGGPEPDHDVDFVVAAGAVEAAAAALTEAGLRVERPAEDWLFKAWWDGGTQPAMVDVVHALAGRSVDTELIGRAVALEVVSVRMPVLTATDVLVTKMRALTEHYCDFSRLLPSARALREQVDWDRVRTETDDNPYAAAFLVLLERLAITGN